MNIHDLVSASKVAPPLTPSQQDREVPIKGYQAVMVRTMTASGMTHEYS